MQNFAELKLSPSTLNAVRHMGYETPTAIQAKSIPELIAGRDIIAQARTGTGKTAAFGIPLVERLGQVTARGVHGLVLVPTRELCLQVAEHLKQLAHGARLRIVEVYGGVGYGEQTNKLRSNDPIVVVATPGRLVDHIERGNIRLDAVKMLVLDEADRMLDMGFFPDVERIIKLVAKDRITALFSATVPEPIRRLSQKFLRNPITVAVEAGPTATPNAAQYRIDLQRSQKTQGLLALLRKEQPESAIVFTRTKHLARRLARQLHAQGFASVALQGNMSQPQRERAMESFRDAEVKVLVATDIASRGLDVAQVSHVINYDVPVEPEAYVH
ncbi:MAG TPA: DEAD/DEAH box helicase, partial [Candidatus Thermoplasmatota archaeon]|nr:DEAD/DEAH box helicase [Candidatus Thermoplasmatota archaeon]